MLFLFLLYAEEGEAGAPEDEKALAQQEDFRIRSFAIAQACDSYPCVTRALPPVLRQASVPVKAQRCAVGKSLHSICLGTMGWRFCWWEGAQPAICVPLSSQRGPCLRLQVLETGIAFHR